MQNDNSCWQTKSSYKNKSAIELFKKKLKELFSRILEAYVLEWKTTFQILFMLDFIIVMNIFSGWIASIPVAFLTGANPLSCSLSVRFGYRPVIFAGVLLVVFGLFIVSAANHPMIIFVSYRLKLLIFEINSS